MRWIRFVPTYLDLSLYFGIKILGTCMKHESFALDQTFKNRA